MRTLTRPMLAVVLAAATAGGQLEAQTAPFTIADGTPVKLRLARNLSSADAQTGETVDFEVLEDIVVNGVTVAQRGGHATATVTDAKPKGRMGKAGKLNVNIDHLRLLSGERVALRAVKNVQGNGSGGKMTGAIVATSLVFWPAAPFFLMMRGKDITIPKGTEITAYVNGDVRMDPNRFMAQQQQPPAAPQMQYAQAQPQPQYAPAQPQYVQASANAYAPAVYAGSAPAARSAARIMSNEDVLELRRAGFGDELIIAKVRGSAGAYRVETRDLVELKRAGVSQAVIAAMVERSGRNYE